MYAQVEKSKEDKSRAVANSVAQKKGNEKQGFGFVDNRYNTKTNNSLQMLMRNKTIQRDVVDEEGDVVDFDDFWEANGSDFEDNFYSRDEIERFFNEEKGKKNIGVESFKNKFFEESDNESDDEEWDPADHASDPLEPDDILSSEVRKSLGFNATAKNWMKIDTPKNMTTGIYLCHICRKDIKKGEKVDMDHLPPWKERLQSFITCHNLTEEELDEITGPNMKLLYNMRGSVFAHSSCNRGHSGEGNYKKKWGNSDNWYKANGGPPFK